MCERSRREWRSRCSEAGSTLRSEAVSPAAKTRRFRRPGDRRGPGFRVKSQLEAIEARDELLALAARRRDLEQGLAKLYREMVARAAWLEQSATRRRAYCRRCRDMRRRFAASGKAPVRTQLAIDATPEFHMTSAAGAVPCWIMSHAKISESMPGRRRRLRPRHRG